MTTERIPDKVGTGKGKEVVSVIKRISYLTPIPIA